MRLQRLTNDCGLEAVPDGGAAMGICVVHNLDDDLMMEIIMPLSGMRLVRWDSAQGRGSSVGTRTICWMDGMLAAPGVGLTSLALFDLLRWWWWEMSADYWQVRAGRVSWNRMLPAARGPEMCLAILEGH